MCVERQMKLFCFTLLCSCQILGAQAQALIGNYRELSDSIWVAAAASEIICLGEASHGDINAHAMKVRILSELIEREPVGAILFEAPLVASVMAYLKDASYAHFVWPFWKYEGLRESLDSLTRKPGMVCLGFDPQETCDFLDFSASLVSEGYLKQDSRLAKMDSLLSIAVSTAAFQETRLLSSEEAQEVERLIADIRLDLSWPAHGKPAQKELINICLDNRIFLAKQMSLSNVNEQMNFRDSIMALNIHRIDEIFQLTHIGEKTVIWAANVHIAKKVNSRKIDFMMERYIREHTERVLPIGIIPRRQRRASKRYDFAVISGAPYYLTTEELKKYDCK